MHDALMLLAALLANLAGMGWLALAMEAHWRQVHAGAPPRRATVHGLRLLGATALLGSLALCIAVDHPSMAVLVWVMALAAAALATAFMLSWRPHWLRWLCPPRTATGEHGDGSSGR